MKTLILAALFSLVFIPQGLAQTAAPAEAVPPTAASPCVVGLGLDVLWNDSWFPATVEAGPNETGQCQIGYDGYGDEWDEWVGADRMRPRQ